jgi:hypothetical protein
VLPPNKCKALAFEPFHAFMSFKVHRQWRVARALKQLEADLGYDPVLVPSETEFLAQQALLMRDLHSTAGNASEPYMAARARDLLNNVQIFEAASAARARQEELSGGKLNEDDVHSDSDISRDSEDSSDSDDDSSVSSGRPQAPQGPRGGAGTAAAAAAQAPARAAAPAQAPARAAAAAQAPAPSAAALREDREAMLREVAAAAKREQCRLSMQALRARRRQEAMDAERASKK